MTSSATETSRRERTGSVRWERIDDRIAIDAEGYRLVIEDAGERFARSPYAHLYDREGWRWCALNLLSSVHRTDAVDETWGLSAVEIAGDGDDVLLSVTARSTAWESRVLTLRCTPASVEASVRVTGDGCLGELTIFGGRAVLATGASGTFRSGIGFASLFVPAPTEPMRAVRPATAPAALGVVGDDNPGRLNALFSPPPLVLGLGRVAADSATVPADTSDGEWLGLSVRAPVAQLTFTTLRYDPVDAGFLLRLDYDGHTEVHGEWTSPVFVLRPAGNAWQVIDDHRDDLVASGFAPAGGPERAAWWSEPIFCGWGAQCARASRLIHRSDDTAPIDPMADTAPQTEAEEGLAAAAAAALARQDVYDDFLARLADHGLDPGTVVIDDRWQAEYGTATPDTDKWPDLAGWIADQHAAGRKVLLWWKAWDPSGLPASECVLDPAGRAIAADPANPDYRRRLAATVAHLLSADGLDADGFKVDFTQRAPAGQSLTSSDGAWGIAALHLLLSTLYDAAKAAKPDSLVICHAVHPSFADTCDMVRLNDVLKFDVDGRRVPVTDQLAFRAAVAARALPEHPIDTDQWPMPSRQQWLEYADAQIALGVPALYYLEAIDKSGEHVDSADLRRVAETWRDYREARR